MEGKATGLTPAGPQQALPSRATGSAPAVETRAPARPEASLAIGQIDVTVVNQAVPPPAHRFRAAEGTRAGEAVGRLEAALARRGLAWFPLKP